MNPIISSINIVQDYIEKHMDEPLDLSTLASIAQFSEYYFHRTYSAVTGESLYAFIKRVRLEKSAFLLLTNPKLSITEVGMAVGFSSSATYAKAFKQFYGVSATEYKKGKNGKALTNHQIYNGEKEFDSYYRTIETMTPVSIEVKKLPAKSYVFYRYTGPYKGDSDLFQRLFTELYNFVKKRKLPMADAEWITLYHDFGSMTEESLLRLSVCMETREVVPAVGAFGTYTLEEGLYVVGRFEVTTEEYQRAWDYMFMHWLPEHPYYNDERLSFESYPPVVPMDDKKRVVDICVPIAPK